jgi:hypothetical protein
MHEMMDFQFAKQRRLTQEDDDEPEEVVLPWRAPQPGGSPPRPGHRGGLRARGRSRVPGRLGGTGPTVGAYRQLAPRRSHRRGRVSPRVHARRSIQETWTPILRRPSGGCNPNCETLRVMQRAGFGAVADERFELPTSFGIALPHLAGTATK